MTAARGVVPFRPRSDERDTPGGGYQPPPPAPGPSPGQSPAPTPVPTPGPAPGPTPGPSGLPGPTPSTTGPGAFGGGIGGGGGGLGGFLAPMVEGWGPGIRRKWKRPPKAGAGITRAIKAGQGVTLGRNLALAADAPLGGRLVQGRGLPVPRPIHVPNQDGGLSPPYSIDGGTNVIGGGGPIAPGPSTQIGELQNADDVGGSWGFVIVAALVVFAAFYLLRGAR